MRIEIYCSMCGKELEVEINQNGLDPHESIASLITRHSRWIVQYNEPALDLYCSEKCAE
jgi:hypothetical protein